MNWNDSEKTVNKPNVKLMVNVLCSDTRSTQKTHWEPQEHFKTEKKKSLFKFIITNVVGYRKSLSP